MRSENTNQDIFAHFLERAQTISRQKRVQANPATWQHTIIVLVQPQHRSFLAGSLRCCHVACLKEAF